MKKCLTLIALLALAVGSAQADTYNWGDGQFGMANGGVWNATSAWALNSASVTTVQPGRGDDVKVEKAVISEAYPVTSMPTLVYDAGTVNALWLGVDYHDGDVSLTIADGGALAVAAHVGVGWQPGTGTLDMTGGSSLQATTLYVGYAGDGIINLSDDALLDITGNLAVAWGPDGGSGSMTMDGDSMFRVLGDLTGAGWENTLITAVGAGDSIDVNFFGGATEYTVIPEPATLGLFGLLGGGLLWVRKRFAL